MASDILRENWARNVKNNSLFPPNRFSHLRDFSPASSGSGSLSTKRKNNDGTASYAQAAKKMFNSSKPSHSKPLPTEQKNLLISAEDLETIEVNSAKAKVASICEKLHSAIGHSGRESNLPNPSRLL